MPTAHIDIISHSKEKSIDFLIKIYKPCPALNGRKEKIMFSLLYTSRARMSRLSNEGIDKAGILWYNQYTEREGLENDCEYSKEITKSVPILIYEIANTV